MAITPEIEAEILREYRSTRSPYKVSRKVGVTIEEVLLTIENHEDKLSAAPERFGGWGRPDISSFFVARRKASERTWDNTSSEIALARANYEAGTHIMATGRDGAWLLLYSFPRKGRPDRNLQGYFEPDLP